MRRLLASLLVLCISISSGYAQKEKILNFDVLLEVHPDRSVTVTEEIEVLVARELIQRGITRALPLQRELNGKDHSVSYTILDIEKDGRQEPYHQRNENGHLTLYLGQESLLLAPGTYTYKIRYKAADQIGIFEDYDEIYWNAIGTDIRFPVEQATCRVQLPASTTLMSDAAYVGLHGERSTAYTSTRGDDYIDYRTSRLLRPGEAFTVSVGFEKGIISPPSLMERLGSIIMVGLGSLIMLPYLFLTWYKYGQDPPTPPSYPIWNAPDDLSSASVNYIAKGHYESKSFTASIVHLAIAGYLTIEENVKKGFLSKSRNYDLVKSKEPDEKLSNEEADLMQSLFRYADRVSISGKYDETIEESYLGHQGNLSAQHRAFLQKGNNSKMLIAPALAFLAVMGLAIAFLVKTNYANQTSLGAVISFGILGVVALALYSYLIRKPTPEKLDLRSRIKGFKMYLELAEKDRLQLLNPPDMNPSHFESILPYAFALGVEHKWTKKFEGILQQAQYRPEWHNSNSTMYFSRNFSNDFSSSVGTATTKPTDPGSGSTGGGFAGGGGGGGGVGGW